MAIDIQDDMGLEPDDGAVATATLERPAQVAAPRNRQELVAELQKHYTEVIDLVRKVNAHLDRQEERSARLMAIADRLPEAVDSLADVRRQNGRMLEAMESAAATSAETSRRVEDAVGRLDDTGREQITAITGVREGIEKSRQTELQLVQTMAEFRTSVNGMSDASGRIGETLNTIHRSTSKREAEMLDLVNHARRWTMIAMIGCAGAAGLALVVSVVTAVI